MTTTEAYPSRSLRDAPRANDGYYGPDSVSWRVFADAGSAVGAFGSLLLQLLDAGMLTHFERVSVTNEGPEESAARFQRTTAYLRSSVFADKAHADAASAHVNMLHKRAVWTDPVTGETTDAQVPEWQRWTWYTYVWGTLHGYLEYGAEEFPAADQDRFVAESQIGAEHLEVPGPYFQTRAELDAYIVDGLKSKSLTLFAAKAASALRHPDVKGIIAKKIVAGLTDGLLYLLPEDARLLLGVEDHSTERLEKGRKLTKQIIAKSRKDKSTAEAIAETLGETDLNPYQKVRSVKQG